MAQLKPGPKPVKAQRRTALRPVLTVLSTGWRGKTSTHDGVVLGALRRGHGEVEARGEGRGVLAARDAHHGGVGADDVAGECSTATNTGGGAAAVAEREMDGAVDSRLLRSIPRAELKQATRRRWWCPAIYPGTRQSVATSTASSSGAAAMEVNFEGEEAGKIGEGGVGRWSSCGLSPCGVGQRRRGPTSSAAQAR